MTRVNYVQRVPGIFPGDESNTTTMLPLTLSSPLSTAINDAGIKLAPFRDK